MVYIVQCIVVVEQRFKSLLYTAKLAVAQLAVHLHTCIYTSAVPARTTLVACIVGAHQVESQTFDKLIVEGYRSHGAVLL